MQVIIKIVRNDDIHEKLMKKSSYTINYVNDETEIEES